jgi:hypothetical protein
LATPFPFWPFPKPWPSPTMVFCDWPCHNYMYNVKQQFTSCRYVFQCWSGLRLEVAAWGGLGQSYFWCDSPHLKHFFLPLVPWDMMKNDLKFLFVSLALLWHNCLTLWLLNWW